MDTRPTVRLQIIPQIFQIRSRWLIYRTSAGDPGTRAFASAGLNVWAWVFIATVPLAVFKTTDQPAVVSGNFTAAGFCFILAITAVLLAWLEKSKQGRATDGENFTSVEDDDSTSVREENHEITKRVSENAGGEIVKK